MRFRRCQRFLCGLVLCSLLLSLCSTALAAEIYAEQPGLFVGVNEEEASLNYDLVCDTFGIPKDDDSAFDALLIFLALPHEDFEQDLFDAGYTVSSLEDAYLLWYALTGQEIPDTYTVTNISGGVQYTGENLALQVGKGDYAGKIYLGYLTAITGNQYGYFHQVASLSDMQSDIAALQAAMPSAEKIDEIIRILGSPGAGSSIFSELLAIYTWVQEYFGPVGSFTFSNWDWNGSALISSSVDSPRFRGFLQTSVSSLLNRLSRILKNVNELNSYLSGSSIYVAPYFFNEDGTLSQLDYTSVGIVEYLRYILNVMQNQLAISASRTSTLLTGAGQQDFTTYSYNDAGELQEDTVPVTNVIQALIAGFQDIGLDLAKLQFVLANDDDIKLRADMKDQQDAFQDSFTGSGDGAASVSDVKDAALISGSTADLFKSDVSVSQFYQGFADDSLFEFFTETTRDNLDQVNAPQAVSDEEWKPEDVLDGLIVGDDGLVHPEDSTLFDLSAYFTQKGG